MSLPAGLGFFFPLAFAGLLLVVPAIVLELRSRGPRSSVPMTGVAGLRAELTGTASRRKAVRAGIVGIVAALLALAASAPVLRSSVPLLAADRLATQKNIILAIDVSRSMSGPLAVPDRESRFRNYGGTADAAGRQSRYAAARDTVYRFVERFPDARIGLILFSTEPFLARWPTVETGTRFVEVLDENLDEASQLRRFSSLTNTDAALELARDVFATLDASGGAVIHISDAEDDLENMGLAIRNLRNAGIRLYTFGVGISTSVVDKLEAEFPGDPGFRIFRVDSEAEMEDAYRLVAELEESPRYTEAENTYVTELRWLVALLSVVVAIVALWLLELRIARTPLVFPVARRDG